MSKEGSSTRPRSSSSKKAFKARASTRLPNWPPPASQRSTATSQVKRRCSLLSWRASSMVWRISAVTCPRVGQLKISSRASAQLLLKGESRDSVALMRATIAEAQRFPALSRDVHEATRSRAADVVSRLLKDSIHTPSRSPKGPFGSDRILSTAQIFMDLILLPMLMRSLVGDEPRTLRKELPNFVSERVSFFLAACGANWKQ